MAIQRELWVSYIQDNLFKNNSFIDRAYSESASVLGGKVVHLPQAGAKPVVQKNTTGVGVAVSRTDTDITYNLDAYRTIPTVIEKAEQAELSYEKMNSILGEHLEVLRERCGDEMAIKWLTGALEAGNVVSTTGADAAVTESGQTGNRKTTKAIDVLALKTKMNKQNIAKDGRVLVCESNMLDQLVNDLSVTQQRDFSSAVDSATGVVGRLYGFEIIERSDVAICNGANSAVNAFGSTTLGTDNLVCLAFQRNAVAKAVGEIDVFENTNDPLHYGNVYSALVRFGGRARRTNAEGVFALVQGAGS